VGQDHWEGYTRADGLSSDLVWAAGRDGKGRLWIGTQEGLDWTAAGEHTPHAWRLPGGKAMSATTLAAGSDGSLWAANVAGELVRIDPVTLSGSTWKLPPVSAVASDGHGAMWIASAGGLFRADAAGAAAPELVRAPVFVNPQQHFTSLYLDPRGRLWASAEQGLVVQDASGWHAIDMGQQRTMPDVIAVDATGSVWASGPAQSLTRLRIDRYRVIDSRQVGHPPLLSQQIVSLMVDHRGWLWVGQDQGLSVFDGYTWRSYTQDDGLIWNDTDSFALFEDKDGSLWVGTSGGLAHLLTPSDQQYHASPQAPVFSKVLYGSEQLMDGGSTRWASNSVEISLALLSFKNTQDTRIRYRLIGPGQPGDWEESHEMLLHYRHLAPGAYRFEATEVDQAGRVVSPLATFSFRITPRWWQLTWLRIGLTVVVLLAMFLIWRQRIGQLLRQKKQLEEAVKMRTVDLEREKGELLRTKEQMRHYAEHDDLTGLWNHRIIVERLQIEVDRSRREGLPLSVILVDLDFFKNINDSFGHPAGDAVLRQASAIFQHMVRTYDWVGRYGGEEFLLILPGSGFTHARERAEDLRKALESAQIRDGDSLIPVTASFGVASGFPAGHEELIRQADAALYRAKNEGRNCVVAIEVDARKLSRRA
jgi:diguanylate cyclase (GGDEF)-like protein